MIFAEPDLLYLLVVPGVLFVLWMWNAGRRRADVRRLTLAKRLPFPERFTPMGDLMFWLCLLVSSSLVVVALARPQAVLSQSRTGAIDVVILQDASASMYVKDVPPDRWQRAVQFLRTFGETLRWRGDRVALALFARSVAPQARLTSDPNAFFFFLDHLDKQSPFRLEDNVTWDTNIGESIFWGIKLVEKDGELFGRRNRSTAFVVISDGQSEDSRVSAAVESARKRQIAVYAVGVGTMTGGIIPDPLRGTLSSPRPIRAVLDRDALRELARSGGGEYYELGRETDREVAFKIINSMKLRANESQLETAYDDLHWRCLFGAGMALCLGTLCLKRRTELWAAAGTLAALLILAASFW